MQKGGPVSLLITVVQYLHQVDQDSLARKCQGYLCTFNKSIPAHTINSLKKSSSPNRKYKRVFSPFDQGQPNFCIYVSRDRFRQTFPMRLLVTTSIVSSEMLYIKYIVCDRNPGVELFRRRKERYA